MTFYTKSDQSTTKTPIYIVQTTAGETGMGGSKNRRRSWIMHRDNKDKTKITRSCSVETYAEHSTFVFGHLEWLAVVLKH